MTTSDWITSTAAIVGVLVAAGGLAYAGLQLRSAQRSAQAEVILEIETQLARFFEVHTALLPGGEWAKGLGPREHDEWARAWSYVGLFERIELLRRRGLVLEDAVRSFYAFRVSNILGCEELRAYLTRRREGWELFWSLAEWLGHPSRPTAPPARASR